MTNKEKITCSELQAEFISNELTEYNKTVDLLKNNSEIPKVYIDFGTGLGFYGFYVRERDEENQIIRPRLIFIAKNYGEMVSFIRGLKSVISYLSIKF